MSSYLAHRGPLSGREELLSEHLKLVAERAREHAAVFGVEEEGYMAGLLHDIGKYGALFQQRLRGQVKGVDHWSAGAWIALRNCRLIAAALAIQGHHIGLQAGSRDALLGLDPRKLEVEHPLRLKLSETDHDKLLRLLEDDSLALPAADSLPSGLYPQLAQTASAMLDVRMLFSALVDADFIETEAWFQMNEDGQRRYRETGLPLEPGQALDRLKAHLDTLARTSSGAASMQELRASLLQACLTAADCSQGLFTLTAPTGSGKTLSMLGFALAHAAKHDLRRIVFVVPYLNIIEQTVEVYRRVFSPHFSADTLERYVLEHHSMAGTGMRDDKGPEPDEDYGRHLLTENWDAPIVVTTNVQLLESLFSNSPSACRKLHRLARSVILFDEVQTMPLPLAIPTLATLSHLTALYHATIVFATATQPAFNHLDRYVKRHCAVGWQPREVVPEEAGLFSGSRRTAVKWPDGCLSWDALAGRLIAHKQAMCVVNLKRHAKDLFDALVRREGDGVLHLSTNMCPAHRQAVLAKVRSSLDKGMACHLVSTQCVEAGVDIDFPVVYRALGPLDAIAQAAGRCNRNGHLKEGEVHVFRPEPEAGGRAFPDGAYAQAADITNLLLAQRGAHGMDIGDPALFQKYYRILYDFARPEDHRRELIESIAMQDFREVDRQYQIIGKDSINVLVPYVPDAFRQLRGEALNVGLTRRWIMQARPYAVSLFRPKLGDPLYLLLETVRLPYKDGEESDEWYMYQKEDDYDQQTGLNPSLSPNLIIA